MTGFVVEPEVRQVDSSSSILLSQDCFGYSRFFVFPKSNVLKQMSGDLFLALSHRSHKTFIMILTIQAIGSSRTKTKASSKH